MDILICYTNVYNTDDLRTIYARCCRQHHDARLSHSCNSPNKEFVQLEDRKRSMNTMSVSLRLDFTDVLSQERSIEFGFEEQTKRRDMIHIHLQRAKLMASKTVALMIHAASRIEDLPCLLIDFFADKGKNKTKTFRSQGLRGYNTFPCKGTQRSKKFHSKRPLGPTVLNYVGLRQRSRDSHIEGLQRSETLYSADSHKPDKSPYMSKSKTVNSAVEPKPDNFSSYRTEGLRRSKTLQDESLNRSQTLHSECLQTSDELYSHSFNDATHPPFEGTRGINSVFQNALQAFILQISMLPKIAGKYRHVVILVAFLTRAACTDVEVPINCTSGAVITSPNYPSTYPQFDTKYWSFTAPEGRKILLTFNHFSLGPSDKVSVIDTFDSGNRQCYSGEENTIPPFMSRRNSLLLRFTSDETPTGKGFNISATCYELPETRVGRLTGGHTPAEGFLELQAEAGGRWMRVCGEHLADRVAEVVCGELGFHGAKEVSYEYGECSSEGADRDCIRAPSCGNYAYRSQDCSWTDSYENCTLSMVVKVKCFEPGFKGCYDLETAQLKNGSSYNSTSQCITLCREDTPQAIAIINGSECFCSSSDYIGLSSFDKLEARSCAIHQLVYNANVGFCNQMDDIMNGSWNSDVTWFGSIVHLTCNDGYSLKGSGTLQCITEAPSYLPVWNGSIPTCEMMTDTSYPMTSGQGNTALAISPPMTALLTAFFTALLICILCGAVWKCRNRTIHKQHAAPATTATGESDLTNRTRALPRTPIEESLPTLFLNRSQHVTRTPLNLSNSSTLHPSLELTALQHGNNNYASGNPYHYAISMTNPPQATPNMGTDVNAYEPEDMPAQNIINAGHRTEMMPMFSRPLPHRPVSVGVQEGPSLPPRERRGMHSSTLSPNLSQNARSDNSHLGACSLAYNPLTNGEQAETVDRMPRNCAITKELVVINPFKGTTSNENANHGYYSADELEHDDGHNGGNSPMSPSKFNPFYHCLEDDDEQMCTNDCDTDVLINNESSAHDDNLAEVMVDNVLYNPMDF